MRTISQLFLRSLSVLPYELSCDPLWAALSVIESFLSFLQGIILYLLTRYTAIRNNRTDQPTSKITTSIEITAIPSPLLENSPA